jgi:branched-chain amino acid transport system substrate-binding protein
MNLPAAARVRRLLAALTVTALLSAPFAIRPAAAADTYEINAILSLTGPFAFLGTAEAASLRTLEPLINKQGGIDGQQVHFNILDDGSQPPVAVQLANGIIAKHVAVMLGPTYSASCLAVAPLVRANGPVQYCFAPTIHPPAGSYTFSGGASSRDQAIETLVFAQAKGWKRLAYIATTDATGQDIEEQFKDVINLPRFAGMSLVTGVHFTQSDVSIAAQLANIKATNPDAILAMTVGATGTVLRSLKDAGLDGVPMISNLGNLINAALAQFAPYMPREMYFTAPRFYAHDVSGRGPVRDAQLAFVKAFNDVGVDPDVGNNFPWDPTLIVIAGLRKLGPSADAKSLLNYILSVHDFAGSNGIYNYTGGDQRGQGLSDLVMVRWDAAKKHVVTASQPGGKPLP